MRNTLRILLFNFVLVTVLLAQDYLTVGDFKIFPYSPEGNRNWPTGYMTVVVDSGSGHIHVDSVGSERTHQSFKNRYLDRMIGYTYAWVDSFLVYNPSGAPFYTASYTMQDPIGVGFYRTIDQDFVGLNGDIIKLYIDAYKETKETRHLYQAINLWKQIRDSSYVAVNNKYGGGSVNIQSWLPKSTIQWNDQSFLFITSALYDVYTMLGREEYKTLAEDVHNLCVTWLDTVATDSIRLYKTGYTYTGNDFPYNYNSFPFRFFEWATAEGIANHSVSGDSLLFKMDRYVSGGIDSSRQLREYTQTTSTTGNWGYTGWELSHQFNGQIAMQAAGYNEPYWDSWQYLWDGVENYIYGRAFYKQEASMEGLPQAYLLAKHAGYDVDDASMANQLARSIISYVYTPDYGFMRSSFGCEYFYTGRWFIWGMFNNLRYLNIANNPISLFPVLSDSICDSHYTWDQFRFYDNGYMYGFPLIAGLKFNLASFDSMTYNTVNDSSILEVSYFHGDTTCIIRHISGQYTTEIKCNYPTEMIVLIDTNDVASYLYTNTILYADTTLWMDNMPSGKDTTITFADSAFSLLMLQGNRVMTIKANATDWTFNIDSTHIVSEPITYAKIGASVYGGTYSQVENRTKMIDMQFRLINYIYRISLGRLALGYIQ